MLDHRGSDDDARTGRIVAVAKRTLVPTSLTYAYDCLVLGGFAASGYISYGIFEAVSALSALACAAGFAAHYSGFSRRLREPSLFLPQTLFGIALTLALAFAAPQIGFQPFVSLLAICAYGLMAPTLRSFIICWIFTAVGAAGVIFASGSHFAAPTATPAGQFFTLAIYLGALTRCALLAMAFNKLRIRLAKKNQELEVANQRIDLLANVDDLTNIANRRAIVRFISEQMANADRFRIPLTVGILDIDHFKALNDNFGHATGDQVLQHFASQVHATIRTTDRVGRYGGEEFLVVLPGANLREARPLLEHILRNVSWADWTTIDSHLRVTATAGGAEYKPGESIEELVHRADQALYRGKRAGRNRVVLEADTVGDDATFDQEKANANVYATYGP